MGGRKYSDKLKMLMSNRRKMAQNCWILGAEAYPNPSLKGRAFQKPTPTPPKREGLFKLRHKVIHEGLYSTTVEVLWTPLCRVCVPPRV